MDFCEKFCVLTLRQKPQLFLIICFLSLLFGGISSLYFYYPDGSSPISQLYMQNSSSGTFGGDEADMIELQHEQQLKELMGSTTNSPNEDLQIQRMSKKKNMNSQSSTLVLDTTMGGGNEDGQGQTIHITLTPEEIENPNMDNSAGNSKLRHHHAENPIMLRKLNELVEKSQFSNVIERRLIHFDLKGAPPKVSFFKEIIKLSQVAGLTGILIEWEDTFPWRNNLKNLTQVENHYTLEQVLEIIRFAEIHGMEVIPLVQTFGHAEFILKTEEFSHLREVPEDPQAFCPSKPDTLVLIEDMIMQIAQVHQNSRFIHIGCDEVFNLMVCDLCKASADSKDVLFIEHVTRVASFVRKLGKIPIIWDDMLRTIPRQKLSESGLGTLVEPMVWVYAEDIDRFVGWETWEKFSSVFPTIWVAGAFKGAFGETLTIPKVTRHAENTQKWVDTVARESHRWENGVGGIVLTGWSRYDHFAVLCELFPVSLPSLVYTSLIASTPTPGASIRNRIFAVRGEIENPSSGSASSSSGHSSPSRRRRRSIRRWVPHPQSLRIKERSERVSVASFAGLGLHATAETGMSDGNPIEQRREKIATEFLRILNCPITLAMTKTVLTAKNSEDDEFSFASRCSFPGISFFRTTFRLRAMLNDVWDLIINLERERGWLTKYNIRHGYSLPLRVEELVFKDIPRFKRNLSLTAKSIAISMKSMYSQDTILEWLEQNVWDAWERLEEIENAGKELKSIKVWARRPLKSPPKMTTDLGLQSLGLENQELFRSGLALQELMNRRIKKFGNMKGISDLSNVFKVNENEKY